MKLLRKLTGFNIALPPLGPLDESRRKNLTNIIRYANTHTPFYKGKYDSFLSVANDMSDEDFFYGFSHLPIVEKNHLRTQNEAFKSDTLRKKVDLLKDGRTPSIGEFIKHVIIKKDFYTALSTGGTSGKPTFRYADFDDCNIFAQSFLHSFKLNGWNPGESFTVYYPLKSYFTKTYADQQKNLNRYFGFTMVPFENITKESVENLLETLRSTKSTLLVIFPCVLQRVAEIMKQENIPPFENLPCINVSGEFFLDCSKNFIQTMFPDSDIQSTYGAVEFGEIAHQKSLSSFDYDVFGDYIYLEQATNNAILVTCYRQKAFPLIRYKIEDMGRVQNNEDGTQSILNLEGKNTDYLIGADDYIYFASFFNEFVNKLNKALNTPIIHFMLRHGTTENNEKYITFNYVTQKDDKRDKITSATLDTMKNVFANYDHIAVEFPDFFEHDYTRKFKIIGEGDGLAEIVGGYFPHAKTG